MPDVLCLYLDDSGTRNPNRKPDSTIFRDWFAQGGIVFRAEDEEKIRELHEAFCNKWEIDYPLHSVDIRTRSKDFYWLRGISAEKYQEFMNDLTDLVVKAPVYAHATVVDRPGYDIRYRKEHRVVWSLCKTAFSVVCERTAKYADAQNRVVRVFVERGDKTTDGRIDAHFKEMRANGMPFDAGRSAKYQPLPPDRLKRVLYDLKFKDKSSAVMQMADLYLYPIARGRYEPDYLPWEILVREKKVIDFHVTDAETLGVKYSCFENVAPKNNKAGDNSGSVQPPKEGTS